MKQKEKRKQKTGGSFFNIIEEGDRGVILLYGNIGDWEGGVQPAALVKELMEAEAKYGEIAVRINSTGGEVYSGITIFNALRNSKGNIRIYIDGIAASMASVIALCGKPVYMSRYARLMIHSVSGGAWGTRKALQEVIGEMDRLEDTLAQMYAGKIGMGAEEVKAEYFDGADHWLTAEEALRLGFIDGIYDADPIPVDDPTVDDIYQTFINRLTKPQNQNQMNLELLKKRPLFKDVATDEDALKVVAQLEADAARVPALDQKVVALEASLKVFEEKARETADAELKALLDGAEQEGRIDAKTRPTFEALLKSDRVNGEAALAALPAKKLVMKSIEVNPQEDSPWNKRMKEIKNNLKK